MFNVSIWLNDVVSGVDADKNLTESTPVISPDGKDEAVNGEIPTENGNNNMTDTEKVSWITNLYLTLRSLSVKVHGGWHVHDCHGYPPFSSEAPTNVLGTLENSDWLICNISNARVCFIRFPDMERLLKIWCAAKYFWWTSMESSRCLALMKHSLSCLIYFLNKN